MGKDLKFKFSRSLNLNIVHVVNSLDLVFL